MRKTRAVLLSVVALLAIGAAASSSASAACSGGEEGKTMASWCIGEKVFTGEETYSSTGGPFVLESAFISIECKEETATGTIEEKSGGININRYGKCSVKEASACTVAEPIEVKTNTALKVVGEKIYNIFLPQEASKLFTTIGISGCVLKGKYEVSGEGCSEVGPEAEALTWKFSKAIAEACKAELKIGQAGGGKGKATLVGESKQKLTGVNKGKVWGAKLT
jgi:hypothetical protein